MPRMLDVSDEVRAEIGDEEADRLLAGENAPGSYDCTSCRTPGDSEQERTSTVLFVGEETAVLAFAHATCLPSQVVQVTEEQLQGAVRSISGDTVDLDPAQVVPEQAVLGVTSGLVLIAGELHPALVVEPTGPIVRPGTTGLGDDFLPLLIEQGFMPLMELAEVHFAIHEEFLDDHVLFDFANTFMQGLALSRAHQLGAEAQALLVLDSGTGRDSGTALFQRHWEQASDAPAL